MGTDIHGYVEIKRKPEQKWQPLFEIDLILSRSYDCFGCLFGVRNPVNFRPLFPKRGKAPDREPFWESDDYGDDSEYHSFSWCTYQELLEIDLDELSLTPDDRIWVDEQLPDGRVSRTKRYPKNEQEQKLRQHLARREALSQCGFDDLMALMGAMAKRYGEEHVRLVVWFDN